MGKHLNLISYFGGKYPHLTWLINIDDFNEPSDKIERARRYFIRSQLGYGANGSQNNHKGAGFEYAIQKSNYYRVDGYNFKLHKLHEIAAKLRSMQIEQKDVFELFEKVNKANNIVYFDPPYLMTTRTSGKRYHHEVTEDFHYKLAETVKSSKCFVAISGYDSSLYDELFMGFHKSMGPLRKSTVSKRAINECLWTNYDPITINGALKLDFNQTGTGG